MPDARPSTRTRGEFPVRVLYWITLAMLTLTGFAQMPIFKRYYIADIPGLGWLAQFYVTHHLHYLFAAVFLGLGAFVTFDYLLTKRTLFRVTTAGFVKAAILGGLTATGLLLVVRNLPGTGFSPGMIVFLDLAHMGLVVILIGASAYGVVTRTQWLHPRKDS